MTSSATVTLLTRRCAWLLVLALVACDTGFEKKSIVIDLRVLAIRSDPAEVVLDVDPADPASLAGLTLPPVTFTALIGDPLRPRPVSYRMTACPETITLRCDDPDVTYDLPFAEGTTEEGEVSGVLQADLPLLRAALAQDDFLGLGGVPVIVEVVVRDGTGDEMHAAKRIYYAPRIPPAKVANHNPALAELRARGQTWVDGEPLRVGGREEIELLPVEADGVREVYQVPTLDGGQRSFTENLRYSWLATEGSFSDELTGGAIDIFGNLPLLRTRWRAPAAPADVRLWLVQRDERGGTSWVQRSIQVR